MAEPSRVSPNEAAVHAIEEEIRTLESRLREGEEFLRAQKESGADRQKLIQWEDGWVNLLRRYELLCDRLHRQNAQRRRAPAASPDTRSQPVPSAEPEHSAAANR